VLVVEDDQDIREALVQLLEDEKCIVAAACHGEEGLRRAREHRPEVITLDLMMPVMDGWKFRMLQKRDAVLADIPVIVVSAYGPGSNIDAAAFVPKPCDFDEFVTTVTAHGLRYRETAGQASAPGSQDPLG
jgi:CheY-like chemotaxis protein